MKLWAIMRFELDCQSRQMSTWFYAVVLLLISLQVSAEVSTDYARSSGTFSNDPYFVAMMSLLGSLVGLLSAAAVAGDAAARDAQTRMDPLVYTAPVAKSTYLAGRFLAALTLYGVILLVVPLALVLAFLLTDAELAGPFRVAAYVSAYMFLLLPNAFVTTSLLFAIAVLTRRAIVSYVGALLLFGATLFSYTFVALVLQQWEFAKLLDPLGAVVIGEIGRLWTPAEKGTRLIGLEGSLLANRVFWVGVALVVLATTYLRFRLAHHSGGSWFGMTRPAEAEPPITGAPMRVLQDVDTRFDVATRFRQAFALSRESFETIVMGWGGLIVAVVPAMVIVNGMQLAHMGVPFIATTERMTGLRGHAAIVWLLVALCAGELVWRERDGRLSEIADAAPVPEWVSFLGKFMGISLVLVLVQTLVAGASIFNQAFLDHPNFEIDLYARTLFGLQLLDYMLVAVLALVVHVLVNHKYVAHLLVAIALMLGPARDLLGIEHNLVVYRSVPRWSYSDMRGFEPFIWPWFWFTFYWAAWALLLAIGATVFWVRGKEVNPRARLGVARRRLTLRVAASTAAAMALILTLGGFIFYNTNVLNAYQTASDVTGRRAEYERRYGQYRTIAQPQVADVNLSVEIFSARHLVEIRGTFQLVNKGDAPIYTVHIATQFGVKTESIEFDRATSVLTDDELRHRIYSLERALQPGESLRLGFAVRREPRGFQNDGIDASVVANGTYFRVEQWLPAIGYQPERELRSPAERRMFGLGERPTIAVLHETDARHDSARAARATFEAVVGTDDGQMAIAPGSLRRMWTREGRRYFHYVADAPIPEDYAFFSADYAVRRRHWNDVSLEIVHHPGHAWNVDRMLRSAQASLQYYTRLFGHPYPHRVLRLVEHPGDSLVLHASPINISYQEPFALLNPGADPRGIDLPFAVVAHEVAHQWWGHIVTPARVEGGALLTESLAWYSALALLEETHGRDHVRRFLQMMREAYLVPQPRGNVPLLRADDWFLAYRKGPFAMWALRQYVGQEEIDAVLRRLIERYASGEPPLPTSLDLYRELQAVTPQPLRYLLADLFEANTYWNLETQRVTTQQIATGEWQVALDVTARKVIVNEGGVESDVAMDDLIEFGAFTGPENKGVDEPLYLQTHKVRSGHQRITLTVPRRPSRVGIDPRNLLIELDSLDNIAEVTPAEDASARGLGGR